MGSDESLVVCPDLRDGPHPFSNCQSAKTLETALTAGFSGNLFPCPLPSILAFTWACGKQMQPASKLVGPLWEHSPGQSHPRSPSGEACSDATLRQCPRSRWLTRHSSLQSPGQYSVLTHLFYSRNVTAVSEGQGLCDPLTASETPSFGT